MKKDFGAAIDFQTRSLAEGADPVRGGLALARSYRGTGLPAQAFSEAEKVIGWLAARRVESAEAFHEAAQALLLLGEEDRAREFLTRAAAADPRYRGHLEALEARRKGAGDGR